MCGKCSQEQRTDCKWIKEENHAENNMIIGDILKMDPEMAGVLVAGGMHCIGCPSAQMETIEEAALVHGIEPDLLVARVNAFVESKQA